MPPNPSKCALRAILLLAFAVAWPIAPALAGRVEPPVELLYAPGNLLVAGKVVEIDERAGRLVFERKDVLGKGRVPDQVDVRASAAALARVKPGGRYIFGYSLARADARDPLRTVADPRGPVLLTSIGLDPALFDDTPLVRSILKAGRSEHGRESRRFFDLLMRGLASNDASLQYLAAGEIALEREIGERLADARARALVEKVARDAHTPANVRASLLQSAAARPGDLGDWWQAAAMDVVTTTPPGGYSRASSESAELILLALEVLDQHAVPVAPVALAHWVRSPSPPVAERACLMLRKSSGQAERDAIRDALAEPDLPAQTRKFLNDHLRRLDVMDAKLKARKGGAD
ncbi:hypothetical protein EV148_101206 [Dokdonella fugitiva]|uniref:Uncharacterized protein n=1 Tax=Dokdonella fugitiva TaxID=328517 RepID=A0A4V2S335_9GAMM|nr:hypothetical protein EV148_101206 [Dokdonella fugitiva]